MYIEGVLAKCSRKYIEYSGAQNGVYVYFVKCFCTLRKCSYILLSVCVHELSVRMHGEGALVYLVKYLCTEMECSCTIRRE